MRIAITVAAVVFSGCNTGVINAAMPNPGVAVSLVDAEQRGIVAVRQQGDDGRIYMCPEPPPDVAITDTRSFTGAVEVALQRANVSTEVQREVTEALSQINPTSEATTYLRSALIQMCWLAANTGLSSAEVKQMYSETLRETRTVAYRAVVVEFIRVMQTHIASGTVTPETVTALSRTLSVLVLQGSTQEEIDNIRTTIN